MILVVSSSSGSYCKFVKENRERERERERDIKMNK